MSNTQVDLIHLANEMTTIADHAFVTYSMIDAYEIIVVHEKRHAQQAERVLEAEGFPGR